MPEGELLLSEGCSSMVTGVTLACVLRADPAGFEPAIPGLEGRCFIHAKPRALTLIFVGLKRISNSTKPMHCAVL